jgi:hypothetical protein
MIAVKSRSPGCCQTVSFFAGICTSLHPIVNPAQVCTSKMTIAEASTGRTRTIAVQSDHPRQLRLSEAFGHGLARLGKHLQTMLLYDHE